MASPLIEYIGSKRMAIKTLIECMPYEIEDYRDPHYTKVSASNRYYQNKLNFDFDKLRAELENIKHRFIMTIDANNFGYSLKDRFEIIEDDVFYKMSMSKHKEFLTI